MKKLLLTMALLVIVGSSYLFAETPNTISGVVIDNNKQPIPFATISVYKDTTQKPITGTISDDKGFFVVGNVKEGDYIIKITSINFKDKYVENVKVGNGLSKIELGNIALEVSGLNLNQVQITGQKSPIEFSGDKMIVNVENTLPTAGGSVIDILKNTPTVTVDADGNISLRGSQAVNILVDGKPSGISDPKMLEQMPANYVEKIEVISNPSAKYDAEGTAGIINLITKKRKEADFNGLISLNAGTRDNYNTSVSFNYKYDGATIYGSYDNRFFSRQMNGLARRVQYMPSGNSYVNNDMTMNFKGLSHNVKFGTDFQVNQYNSLAATVYYNRGGNDRRFFNTSVLSNSERTPYNSYVNLNTGDVKGEVIDLSLNYKLTSDTKEQEWTADVYFSKAFNNEDNLRDVDYILPYVRSEQQSSLTNNTNKLFYVKTDYIHPFDDATKLEAGYKGSFRDRNAFYDVWDYDNAGNTIFNTTFSNDFNYIENIHAGYVTFKSAWDKLKYQFGIRAEQTYTDAHQLTTGGEYLHDYIDFFPSANLSYPLFEGHEIRLGYSRRINRPQVFYLNPFKIARDPLNFQAGNPDIQPEYINSAELGYNFFAGQTSFFANFFYRETKDVISFYSELLNDSTTITTFKNYANQKSFGVDLNGNLNLFKIWTLNANYSIYQSEFDTKGVVQNALSQTIWNFRVMNTLMLWEGITLQANFFYFGPMASPQGKFKGSLFTDFGLRKNFFDNALTVNFRVSDVFKAQKFTQEIYAANFHHYQENKMNAQIFTLGITYNINNYKRERDRKPTDVDNGGREYENMGN